VYYQPDFDIKSSKLLHYFHQLAQAVPEDTVYKISALTFLIFFLNIFALPAESAAADGRSFYVRAGGGIALSRNSQFSDLNCSSETPAALFGCSPGNDNRKIGAYGDWGNSAVLDLGVGYRWNEWLRSELSFAYRPGFAFEGTSNFNQISTDFRQTVAADMNSVSGLLIALIEPLPLMRCNPWPVEPIITAGIGMVRNSIDAMVYSFPSTTTITPDGQHFDFAWTVGAGFSYLLSANINIELLYRYVHLGEVKTDADTMIILQNSTHSVINDSIKIGETKADLNSNEVLLSVVWYF
jgi:opacity protein-like surface antigen